MNASLNKTSPPSPWLHTLYAERTGVLVHCWAQGWLQRALPLQLHPQARLLKIISLGVVDSQNPQRFLKVKIQVEMGLQTVAQTPEPIDAPHTMRTDGKKSAKPTELAVQILEGAVEIVDDTASIAHAYPQTMASGLPVVLYLRWCHAKNLNTTNPQARQLVMEENLAILKTKPTPAHVFTLIALRRFKQAWERRTYLTGQCGTLGLQIQTHTKAHSASKKIEHMVGLAAEMRARLKMKRLMQEHHASQVWEWENVEQCLYASMLYYMGAATQRKMLAVLAKQVPYSTLLTLFCHGKRSQVQHAIMARWFGMLGLLVNPSPQWHQNLVYETQWQEYQNLYTLFQATKMEPFSQNAQEHASEGAQSQGVRPWNRLERRLVGFYHHLRWAGKQGLLKSWLQLLTQLAPLAHTGALGQASKHAFEQAFPTPQEEPWRGRFGFGVEETRSGARLIGQQHITMLFSNAVLPVLLGYAYHQHNSTLESLLYRICLILPSETANKEVRWMRQRLLTFTPLKPSLRVFQGLLQLRNDFCSHFEQGCQGCALPAHILGK